MSKLLLITLLVAVALAAKVPGQHPGVHYQPDPTHYRRFRGMDEEEIIEVVCDLDEELIEGIAVTFTNGSCHNLEDPNVGASLLPHERLLDPAYIDGRGIPDGKNRPSAREISNQVIRLPAGLPPNIKDSSRLLIFFGQFMDHDFALILEQEEPEEEEDEDEESEPLELFPELLEVEIPEDDDNFDPEFPMEFGRSEFCLDENYVRQFEAELTPWLDLNTVYGDTQERTNLLREFEMGRMAVFEANGEEFPLRNETTDLFVCGDIRCEENTMLLAWHTIWLRNHNYWAEEYAQEADTEEDEEIFQNARIRNIVEYQYIVWEQYLPYLLGRRTFFELTGEFRLNERVDPVNSLIFTTAVFRYGHSGVSDDFVFLDEDENQARATVALAESFNNPEPILEEEERVAQIFIGQGSLAHDQLDSRVVSGIRDNLFANIPMFAPGFDLPARNIERGRDHGMQTINFYREDAGLDPYECEDDPMDCFNQLTSDTEIAESLYELYGDISQCEMWPCGMAEDNFEDSLLGETFTIMMAAQFQRMREADRIWYENIRGFLEFAEYARIELPITLVDIVERNTGVQVPFDNLFMVSPVWEAYSTDTEYQIEWFLPPSLRDDIEGYAVEVNGDIVEELEATELLFYRDTEAEAGTTFDVRVLAQTDDGDIEIGSVSVQTNAVDNGGEGGEGQGGAAGGENGLSGGAVTGIAIGASVGAIALGAGIFLLVRRARLNRFGAGQDTFLQL